VDSLGLARVTRRAAAGAFWALASVAWTAVGAANESHVATHAPAETTAPSVRIELWADRDDDDSDGVPDADLPSVPSGARADLVALDGRLSGASWQLLSGGEHARLVLPTGRAVPWTHGGGAAWLQGISPGRVELVASARGARFHVTLAVLGIDLRDGDGHVVDAARSHASLERTPPSRSDGPIDAPYDDPDALRVILAAPDEGPGLDGDREIVVESVSSTGGVIDALRPLALTPSPCARGYEAVRCWASPPLRLVSDDVDRNHPLAIGRSIKAQLGGAIVFRDKSRKAQMIRVLGPRNSPVGPIGRFRATLRAFVLRVVPGGAPSIGGTDSGAIEALRGELGAASSVWAQCGITFGDPRQLDLRIVDPPPSHLVSIGDGLGVPASGGEIRLRAEGHAIVVATEPGEGPDRVADALVRAVQRAGLVAVVSSNASIAPAIGPSVDVSIRRRDGALAAVDTTPGAPLSTDRSLRVRIGSVDLSDGIDHFTDIDAAAGTLEERTLLKALDDGDPTTIEVVVVPLFAGGGRIGESFIGSDLSSVRNVVLLDRAGIRARKSSLTLAHELGHVLMDLPGHPDDYGVDTPTLLMDSDAADASPFGPRRLTIEECARAVRQSGPKARVPMLVDWPLAPLPNPAR
jgi:hypothetical protein